MKRFHVLAALVLVAAAACKEQHGAAQGEVAEPSTPEMDRGEDVEEQTGWIGVVTPKEQQEIPAPFTTNVKQYFVEVGAVVNKGDKIALLDDEPLKEQMAKSAADMQAAQASAASASNNAATQRRAFKAGVASKSTMDQALYAASEAEARVRGAKAAFEAVKQKSTRTTLIAPMTGKLALQYAQVGTQVAEGKGVVKIISSDELYVRFAIPTEDADLVKKGLSIQIAIDARGKQIDAQGSVVSVAPELDQVAQMIFAEAVFTKMPEGLQAGLVARIRVPDANKKSN